MSSEPKVALSSLKVTPETEILSDADADIATDDPKTVAPDVGAVRKTVGGVRSGEAIENEIKKSSVLALPDVS